MVTVKNKKSWFCVHLLSAGFKVLLGGAVGLGKLNSILQQPPSNLPLRYDRAPHSQGLEKEPSGEASAPQSILREIRNRRVSFALSDGAFGEPWVLEWELKAPAVPGLSLEFISTSHREESSFCLLLSK